MTSSEPQIAPVTPAARPDPEESGPFELHPDDPFEAAESVATNRVEKVEHTPLPLPPSPAEEHLDGFLADSPTHPGQQDLVAIDDGVITSTRRPAGTDDWPLEGERNPLPVPPIQWVVPTLIGLTCLVIGLILGALLF